MAQVRRPGEALLGEQADAACRLPPGTMLLASVDVDVEWTKNYRIPNGNVPFCEAGRLFADVTAEVPVAAYPGGQGPDPARVAGVDLGIIHPYAVAGGCT